MGFFNGIAQCWASDHQKGCALKRFDLFFFPFIKPECTSRNVDVTPPGRTRVLLAAEAPDRRGRAAGGGQDASRAEGEDRRACPQQTSARRNPPLCPPRRAAPRIPHQSPYISIVRKKKEKKKKSSCGIWGRGFPCQRQRETARERRGGNAPPRRSDQRRGP